MIAVICESFVRLRGKNKNKRKDEIAHNIQIRIMRGASVKRALAGGGGSLDLGNLFSLERDFLAACRFMQHIKSSHLLAQNVRMSQYLCFNLTGAA